MTVTLFSVVHNMAGYLPESDPAWFETLADAVNYTLAEFEHAADAADAGEDHDYAENLSAAAEDLNLANVADGWSTLVDAGSYWQAWSITPVMFADADAADAAAGYCRNHDLFECWLVHA